MNFVLAIVSMSFIVVCVAITAFSVLRALQNAAEVSQRFVDAHGATLETLERTHTRNVEQINSVLDRFMALDFSLFKSYQAAENADEGGFYDPNEEDDEGGSVSFTPGGHVVYHGADVAERLRTTIEEQQLLAEDFGEEFERQEGLRA